MKHLLLSLIIICLLHYSLQAQNYTLKGIITEQTSGESIYGASVYVEGTIQGSFSNAYGFYSLTLPKGNYEIIVSYLGFQTEVLEVDLFKNLEQNVELLTKDVFLEEVVLEGGETNELILRSPQMGVTKLKATNIKKMSVLMGEVDLIKSIQLLPGITNNGEASSGFNVRGGAVDQNLVLLDGATVYNTSHLLGFFSTFNNDAIKDIKLYRGGIPANYGGRVASVLDVRQKDGNQKKQEFKGGIGLVSSRFLWEGPLAKNKGSFLIAGRGSYGHLLLKTFSTIEDIAYFYDINSKIHYEINSKNTLYASAYKGRDVFDFKDIFRNSYGNNTGNLRWNHVLNQKLFSNTSIIFSNYDYRFIFEFPKFEWTSKIDNLQLKYDLEYYINDKTNLKAGISGISYKFNPGTIKPSDPNSPINSKQLDFKRALEFGIYFDVKQFLGDKLTIQYGLRWSNFFRKGGQSINTYVNDQPIIYLPDFDIYRKGIVSGENYYAKSETIANFHNFEPRLALSFQWNQSSAIKASFNKIAQYIHLLSNTSNVTPIDIWTPSGPFIKPQIGNQFSLGLYKKIGKRLFSLEVETYYKKVMNRIDYRNGAELIGQNSIETEIQTGHSRAYGLEVLLKKEIGHLKGWLAYTLSKSEQQTLGGDIGGLGINKGNWYNNAFDKTHDITLAMNYEKNKFWSWGLNFIFQTGRPVTYPSAQYQYLHFSVANYSLRNNSRLPNYHRLDLVATHYPKKHPNREWIFSIYNLYNRQNANAISFNRNTNTNRNEALKTTIFGIVPSITYNLKF